MVFKHLHGYRNPQRVDASTQSNARNANTHTHTRVTQTFEGTLTRTCACTCTHMHALAHARMQARTGAAQIFPRVVKLPSGVNAVEFAAANLGLVAGAAFKEVLITRKERQTRHTCM